MAEVNLKDKEALEKLKELAEGIDYCLMATNLSELPIHSIPMSTKKVDVQGHIWFLSGRDSEHNAHIRKNPRVQLFYGKPGDMEFLVIYGQVAEVTDTSILKDLYRKTDDMWFKGIEDPNLTALQIKPLEAQYWDNKHSKLVSLFKMGVGALTGKQPDLSKTGDLHV